MAPPLSIDLRRRVGGAVAGGISCREAAARFGVGVSSAIRWVAQARETDEVTPKPQGVDRRSQAIEAQAECILALIAAKSYAWRTAKPTYFMKALRTPTSMLHLIGRIFISGRGI